MPLVAMPCGFQETWFLVKPHLGWVNTVKYLMKWEKLDGASRRSSRIYIDLFVDLTVIHQRRVRQSQKSCGVAQYCNLSMYLATGVLVLWDFLYLIGDYCFTWNLANCWPVIQGLYPLVLLFPLAPIFSTIVVKDPGLMLAWCWTDPGLILEWSWIDPGLILDWF